MPDKPKYEDCLDIINEELRKRQAKWNLGSISYMDWDDVCQIIRLHIWKKWHLYDNKRPLPNWIQTIISHQLFNITRNVFYSYSKPCGNCPFDMEGDGCEKFGVKCNACPLYKKWFEFKRFAHDVKMPLTMENHLNEVNEKPDEWFNPEVSVNNLVDYLKKNLEPMEFRIFEMAFLSNETDDQIFKTLKKEGFCVIKKSIRGIKAGIFVKTKEAVYSDNLNVITSSN